ncbi:MAG TPA: hypothetical protein VNW15_16090 [Rhizomicrobium sp.]|nr:hypothetical protein [Rhizomicrobium sp.]
MTHRFVVVCRHGVLFAALIAIGGSQASAAPAAPAPDAGPTVAIKPLTKYTLPDKTASVMLPDGWHVTQTAVGYIRAEGPKGELGFFGVSVPAHDGAGGGAAPPAPLSQPYSADPGDKLSESIQWVRGANQQSPVQVTKIYSKDAFDGPPGFGSCTKITATLGVQRSVLDAEADLCSLPQDKAGNYTNFLKMVAISPALAKTERGTLEAVLASYVVNLKAVEQAAAQQAKQPSATAAAPPSKMSSNSMAANRGPANTNPFTPQGRQGLQQQIDAEIKAGGFTPQMVAAMRAQANRQAATNIAPIARQVAATNQAMDYFDRTTLRDQIPVTITNQGTFWLDTD